MEDIPLPLGLAMILGIIIKVALDRFDRADGSAMTEDGVARSKPPQYQLLGGGVVIFIGLVTLWLGCRHGSTPHFLTMTQVSLLYGSSSPPHSLS